MADPLLAMIGAIALGLGALIAIVALVSLSVQAGLAAARSIGRLFKSNP